MNITHVTDESDIKTWDHIFSRQVQLMLKYHPIEARNDIWVPEELPMDIDDVKVQYKIKDMCWRVTEEICEAVEALSDPLHYAEELVDALHFLVELYILLGWDMEEVNLQDVQTDPMLAVEAMGLACNCLKNKPWKQTHVRTDVPKFKSYLHKAMVLLVSSIGATGHDIFELYFKKSEVNKFRQQSNY